MISVLRESRNMKKNFKEGKFYVLIKKPLSMDTSLECGETTQSVIKKLEELNGMSDPKKPILIKKVFLMREGKKVNYILVNEPDGSISVRETNE
jgi:hypothetical protein